MKRNSILIPILSLTLIILCACEEDPQATPGGTFEAYRYLLKSCQFSEGWDMMTPDVQVDEFGIQSNFRYWLLYQRDDTKAIFNARLYRTIEKPGQVKYILYYPKSKDYSSVTVTLVGKKWMISAFQVHQPLSRIY